MISFKLKLIVNSLILFTVILAIKKLQVLKSQNRNHIRSILLYIRFLIQFYSLFLYVD